MKQLTLLGIAVILCLTACKKNNINVSETRQAGIFKVLDGDTAIEMNGVINRSSLDNFNRIIAAFPNVTTINIKNCDGSSDDETNLKLSVLVHQKKINTHLMKDGLIASGGVDFFLAGIKRTKDANTRVGVHSWAGGGQVATDFPVGHAEHQKYINYYVSVGFTQKQAEDFYYFTINAASAENVHWMTDAEIATYNILTQ